MTFDFVLSRIERIGLAAGGEECTEDFVAVFMLTVGCAGDHVGFCCEKIFDCVHCGEYFLSFSAFAEIETRCLRISNFAKARFYANHRAAKAFISQNTQVTFTGERVTSFLTLTNIQSTIMSWDNNGTSAGTKQLTTIAVDDGIGNITSLAPVNLVSLGDKVLFEGDSPGVGRELWGSNESMNRNGRRISKMPTECCLRGLGREWSFLFPMATQPTRPATLLFRIPLSPAFYSPKLKRTFRPVKFEVALVSGA